MLTENRQLVEKSGGRAGTYLYGLTAGQIIALIIIGVVFWFIGAMSVQFGTQFGMFGPVNSLVAFAAGIPICWVSVLLIIKIAGLRSEQIVPGISLGLGVATFFDGIAITWVSQLYGSDMAEIALGAAWILWGVFGFIAAAFFEAYRRTPQAR